MTLVPIVLAERVAIVAALEAIEVGDYALAVIVLLAALEDGGPSDRPHTCPYCALAFQWPGLRDAHLDRVHYEKQLRAA